VRDPVTKGEALERVLRAWQVIPRKARFRLNWADRDDPVDCPCPCHRRGLARVCDFGCPCVCHEPARAQDPIEVK
jgi:hypothetical protein